jgi:hypothetical protein
MYIFDQRETALAQCVSFHSGQTNDADAEPLSFEEPEGKKRRDWPVKLWRDQRLCRITVS